MSQWFRMYNEALDDPKVQQLPAEIFKGWVNLLCLAARHDGEIPEGDVSFALRIPEQKAAALVDALVVAGLLERSGGTLAPHSWDKRQYKSDVSNERVKRHRDKKQAVTCNVTSAVTVTPSETEAETDTESDKEKGFDEFWKAYPRKVSRGQARRAYLSAVRKADPATLLAGARALAKAGGDPKFTPHAATWLNGERWLDEQKPADNVAPINGIGAEWHPRCRGYAQSKFWNPFWGPEPGKPGCGVPPEILKQHGLAA